MVTGVLLRNWQYGNDSLRLTAQLDASGQIQATFVYATHANVPDTIVLRSGAVYRVLTDHLGSVRLVVDVANGGVVQRLDYDEFGNVLNDTNAGLQPFGFAGGMYDADIGLVRFGARDYDAVTGRWTAKDPILFEGGTSNLYQYANGDPVNWIDPSGLYFCNYSGGPIRVGGTAGERHGHPSGSPGPDDVWREGTLPDNRCVGGDYGPLETPDGPIHDVDSADFNGDGEVGRAWGKSDAFPFGEHVPWGGAQSPGSCAVDLNPFWPGSTPLPWF